MIVFVKAEIIRSYGKGVFGIELPGRELTPKELEVVRAILPDFTDQVYDLMAKQALFSAMCDGPPPESQPIEIPKMVKARDHYGNPKANKQ